MFRLGNGIAIKSCLSLGSRDLSLGMISARFDTLDGLIRHNRVRILSSSRKNLGFIIYEEIIFLD